MGYLGEKESEKLKKNISKAKISPPTPIRFIVEIKSIWQIENTGV